MDKFIVRGGKKLYGEYRVSGAKNAALPVLATVFLADGSFTFRNIPDLSDVKVFIQIIEKLGGECHFKDNCLTVNIVQDQSIVEVPYKLVTQMRASILVLGPLLASRKRARVSLPGGCTIGSRPIDIHISGLKKLGAEISVDHGYIDAYAPNGLHGNTISLDFPTVTGTENLITAAVLAKGTTVINNAAVEPEIVDLCNCLISMGASIDQVGTSQLIIEGKESLNPTDYTIIGDRIEAGTIMCAVAATGGEVKLTNMDPSHLNVFIDKLIECNVSIEQLDSTSVLVKREGDIKPCHVVTGIYPGFPTDLQPQILAILCLADGASTIEETVFENRFMSVNELVRMGANINIRDSHVTVEGVEKLLSAPTMASDLRAGAALVIAALGAEGESCISRVYHIDRGYEEFEKKLSKIGAKIERYKE